MSEKFSSIEKRKYDKKVMDELDSLVKNLDEHCLGILLFYRQHKNQSFGFNKLLKEISRKRQILEVSFSRQTLTMHLNHLLENHIIEVNEDIESRLKIKPRYYKLGPYWAEIFNRFDGQKSYNKISEELQSKTIEQITASLIETSIDFCTRSFEEVILSPKYWGSTEARYYSDLVENLSRTHQKIVSEKNEEEKALQTLKDINILLSKTIREKYNLPKLTLP